MTLLWWQECQQEKQKPRRRWSSSGQWAEVAATHKQSECQHGVASTYSPLFLLYQVCFVPGKNTGWIAERDDTENTRFFQQVFSADWVLYRKMILIRREEFSLNSGMFCLSEKPLNRTVPYPGHGALSFQSDLTGTSRLPSLTVVTVNSFTHSSNSLCLYRSLNSFPLASVSKVIPTMVSQNTLEHSKLDRRNFKKVNVTHRHREVQRKLTNK